MYTGEQIAAELVKWDAARQRIRGLQPVDFTTNQEGWAAHHAAIEAAHALADMLYNMAEDIEEEAEGMRDLLDAIERQAGRELDAFSASQVSQDNRANDK